MKKTLSFVLYLLLLNLFTSHILFSKTPQIPWNNNGEFSAVYDRLLDYYTHGINVSQIALSKDGTKIFFSGKNTDSDLVLRKINADGSNLSSISVPSGVNGVDDVALNGDGSKAFFLASNNDYIFKIEGGTATEILHRTDFSGINDIEKIETTVDGNDCYFSDGGELYRINHNGGAPVMIVDDDAVQRIEGKGKGLGKFAISEDGNTIGFILERYVDSDNHTVTKYELFVQKGSTITQLTNDTENVYKEYLGISGDGSTIVFNATSSVNKWFSINTDGTNKTTLENFNSNRKTVALNYDGSSILLQSALGSRVVSPDGSGGINIFPSTNTIGIYDNGYMSSDGNFICFRYQIRTFPSRYALYFGYLYSVNGVDDAPVFDSISFEPASMPTNDPNAIILVLSKISDPNGLEDIDNVTIDGLVDGKLIPNDITKVPVYFNTDPNDNGNGFDLTADDGIFTIAGKPGGKINEMDQMTVRIGARDKSSTMVVKDVILSIGGATKVEEQNSSLNFLLKQNYPNPFNPGTFIKFHVPKASFVKLKVYNNLGQHVTTLLNKYQSPGWYSVYWDGSNFPSGIYYYAIQSDSFEKWRKMMLLK